MNIITVKRPNGQIEEVQNGKYMFSPEMFIKAFNDTKNAGRGEIISSTGHVTVVGDKTETMTMERDLADIQKQKEVAEAIKANKTKARKFDNLYNEGGEGYNPYR